MRRRAMAADAPPIRRSRDLFLLQDYIAIDRLDRYLALPVTDTSRYIDVLARRAATGFPLGRLALRKSQVLVHPKILAAVLRICKLDPDIHAEVFRHGEQDSAGH